MRKSIGSALVDYAIPTLLVGVVFGAGLFSFVSGDQLLGFLSGSQNMEANKADGQGIIGSNTVKPFGSINPGDLNGTPSAPQSQCSGAFCTIDFGDMVLSGVPSDYSNFVETSGTNGATNKLTSLITQIADQLKQNGDKDGASAFQKLADMGYYLAEHQEMIETFAEQCKTDADPGACLSTKSMGATTPAVPSSLDPYFDNSFDAYNNLYNRIYDLPSYASYSLSHGGNNLTTGRLSYGMLNAYKEIQQMATTDPKITPAMVNVAEELFRQIDTVSTNMYATLRNANGDNVPVLRFDLLTGAEIGVIPAPGQVTMEDLLHPQTSAGTDLNSLLIQAAGQ